MNTESTIDLLIGAAGAVYVVASALLFVFGANMAALAVLSWRQGRVTSAGVELAERGLAPDASLPRVTVQLPIYNEFYVAERAVRAAAALDYPSELLQIQVLDDSTDETVELIRQTVLALRRDGVDIEHLHRSHRKGYKAGALAEGLERATGELVAVLDADFVPRPDFLRSTVGHFVDPELAFVQCRWGHLNRDHSWIARLQSIAIDAHFAVEQAARGQQGFWFNFNGTAGVWRRAAITDAGGWTADTLTEDLDLSYRAHLRGWRGLYRDDLDVPGELPVRMSGFRRQQHRWARGSLECAAKLLGSIWRSDAGRLTKFEATTHLTAYGIHLLLVVLTLVYPLVAVAGVRFEGFATLYGFGYLFLLPSIAPTLFFATGQRRLGRSLLRQAPAMLLSSVLGSGLMLNTLRAAIQIKTRPNPEFERTAKYGIGTSGTARGKRYHRRLDRIVLAEFGFGAYAVFAAAVAWRLGNWGVFLYASIFSVGLIGVAIISIAQALGDRFGRVDPAGSVDLTGLSVPDDEPGSGRPEAGRHTEAVLVMSKQPIPGRSKTRLQPRLDAEAAAELARCFLLDAVQLCRTVAVDRPGLRVIIAGAPAGSAGYFAGLAPDVDHVEQVGDDLGARLDHVISSALARGHHRVVAINSDSPSLPASLIAAAFERLGRPDVDVVLGPAEDGGYYLIGWKRPHPRLVREVEMSTPEVLADTLAIAAEEGLRVELLPSWYDVDEPVDLDRLLHDVAGGAPCGANTLTFLNDRVRNGQDLNGGGLNDRDPADQGSSERA